MSYDAIIVLGRGVYENGDIPESVKPSVEKAVALYKEGVASNVIFSGRWTYKINYTPPTTEAKTMANLAESLGLDSGAIYLEENSHTTVTNAYYIKKNFLMPNNWHYNLLVSTYPVATRAHYVLQYVFGPEFPCGLAVAEYCYPQADLSRLEAREKEKLQHAKDFYSENNLIPGDHETIFQVAEADLRENWINSAK